VSNSVFCHCGRILALLLLYVFCTNSAWGGASMQHAEPHFDVDRTLAFAKKVERAMGQRGAHVAILARVGRPPNELPEGIDYTHVGFAVYSRITTKGGQQELGYAMYNLYQDDKNPARSDLVMDYPPDFFAAVPKLKAGVIIPTPKLQRRLLRLISDPKVLKGFHNPHYSVIANPSSQQFQNCTEYVLRILMGAMYKTQDQNIISANIQGYFKPQVLDVGNIKLWLGSMFAPDVFLDDQHEDKPVTATFNSLARFMQQYHLTQEVFSVTEESQ